jgi:dTDP-glucose 4,6-dehydratase/UDP-glucuronate decarboxylase
MEQQSSRMEDLVIKQDISEIIGRIDNIRFSGKTILLTGGGGFLGTYFVHYFAELNDSKIIEKPCKLYVVENFIRGIPNWFESIRGREDIEIIEADINKPLSLPKSDFIIHAATIASPTYYRMHPIETMDANVIGLRNLLDFIKDNPCESLLFFSTSEIYGDPPPEHIPTKETYRGNVSCTGPRACYDESKRYGETLCVNFYQQYNIPVKVARPFNNFGPGLRLSDKRVIPDFFNNVLEGNKIVILSDGKATRTFCYISDAITGYLQILLSDYNGEAFNIGTDAPEITMLELAQTISKVVNSSTEIKHEYKVSEDVDYLTDNPQRRCPDLTKSKTLLGYNPQVSLEEGLTRIYNYYKNNRS